MVDIEVKKNETGYDAVYDYIFRFNKHTGNCGSVVIRIGVSNDGKDYWYHNEIVSEESGVYIHEHDWWEGEKFIRLIGVQAVDEMDISGGVFEE